MGLVISQHALERWMERTGTKKELKALNKLTEGLLNAKPINYRNRAHKHCRYLLWKGWVSLTENTQTRKK